MHVSGTPYPKTEQAGEGQGNDTINLSTEFYCGDTLGHHVLSFPPALHVLCFSFSFPLKLFLIV